MLNPGRTNSSPALERGLTVREVAGLLAVAERTVYAMLADGRLRGHKAGRVKAWRVMPAEVRRIQSGK